MISPNNLSPVPQPPPPPKPPPTHRIGENRRPLTWVEIATAAFAGICLCGMLYGILDLTVFGPYPGLVLEKFMVSSSYGTEYRARIRTANGDEQAVTLHREDFDYIRVGDRLILRRTQLRFTQIIQAEEH